PGTGKIFCQYVYRTVLAYEACGRFTDRTCAFVNTAHARPNSDGDDRARQNQPEMITDSYRIAIDDSAR
ncbi:hypothetical protein AIZ23_24525, partial [Salmonella enterica subsp. enterica serovar Typhimurium]